MTGKLRIASTFFALMAFSLSPAANAYYSTLDTGEVIESGHFGTMLETQFITSKDTGVNLNGRVDYGLNEASSVRGIVGFGTTDFQIGGFYKWVPFPDVENQPAIGITAGALVAKFNEGGKSFNEFSVRFTPIVSKKFEVDFGRITPYASVPMGLRSFDGKSEFPVQLAGGSELRFVDLKKMSFFVELGFDINDAFSYVSLSANLDIDPETGISVE